MDLIRIFLSRCLALLRRRKLDEDLDEELRTHIDLATEEYLKRGVPEQVARTTALREFGGVTQTKEQYHVQRGLPFLEVLGQDVSFGLRLMRRSPGYSAVCLLTLCLGIGVNAAVFSVIQAVILRPLPYRDSNRLMHLADSQDPQDGGILYKDFASLKQQSQSFVGMAVYYRDSGRSRVTLTGTEEAESVQGAFVSSDFFPLLGMSPLLGRVFTPEEDLRHERAVVLSYGLWQRRFGASPDIVGQRIRLDGGTSGGNRGHAGKLSVSGPRFTALGSDYDESLLGRPITQQQRWFSCARILCTMASNWTIEGTHKPTGSTGGTQYDL